MGYAERIEKEFKKFGCFKDYVTHDPYFAQHDGKTIQSYQYPRMGCHKKTFYNIITVIQGKWNSQTTPNTDAIHAELKTIDGVG